MTAHLKSVASSPPVAASVAPVVERLAQLRFHAQRRRYPGDTPQLPSRQSILSMTEDFLAALYPRHLGEVALQSIDAFVENGLKRALAVLEREIGLEQSLSQNGAANAVQLRRDPSNLTSDFVAALPHIRELVDTDIRASLEADPLQGSFDELVFCSPGVAAILRHRVAHELYLLGVPLMAKIVAEDSHSKTGIDIHPGAEIGEGFSIANGAGLSIGETTVIGSHVRIHQSVTLGDGFAVVSDAAEPSRDAHSNIVHRTVTLLSSRAEDSASESRSRRHPLIEDGVVIHAGASLYGPIVIGKGSVIGRNVWLTDDVPPGVRIE